jgi:integrase
VNRKKPGARAANGAGSFYRGSDGSWHGRVTVGVGQDGKPDRRHVRGRTEQEVRRKIRAIEKARDEGHLPKPGQGWTVEQWLTHWVENIAGPTVRPSTLAGYRFAVNKHLVPAVGGHRLDRLEPEHLEKVYARMLEAGRAPATAHQAHRTVRTALNEAVRRGHLPRNPAVLAKPPRVVEWEVEPLTLDEVRRVLFTAGRHRNRARWAVALALGLRQGEALGLQWSDVDLDARRLVVRRSMQRPSWAHGCGGRCGRHAGSCPKRRNLHATVSKTKSRAGRRVIGLPSPLVELLREHRAEQDRERGEAAQLWHGGSWVFTTSTGQPIHYRTDNKHWKDLLREAGVRDVRLHDARHTAATVLLLLGIPERTAMGLMGWSHSAMAARYQHLTAAIQADVADRVGGLLWATSETTNATTGRRAADGSDR